MTNRLGLQIFAQLSSLDSLSSTTLFCEQLLLANSCYRSSTNWQQQQQQWTLANCHFYFALSSKDCHFYFDLIHFYFSVHYLVTAS